MPTNKTYLSKLIPTIILILFITPSCTKNINKTQPLPTLSSDRLLTNLQYQLSLGARYPGSPGHQRVGDWIVSELLNFGWQVDVQEIQVREFPIRNIVARIGTGRPWIILGAHYDTRKYADEEEDAELRQAPVPGANDGASGVALLLELARLLPGQLQAGQIGRGSTIELVFFDAEDNGRIEGMEWAMGSQVFVDRLTDYPDAVIIVDMIGDADLKIYMEGNSDLHLMNELWKEANNLNYTEYFISEVKYYLVDDHTAFISQGIPAVDIIDFNYPYWHTTHDTLDKVSTTSLVIVGNTLVSWLQKDTK